jgi:hypothetical protein
MRVGWTTRRQKMMVFCKVLMAIPLYMTLLSSSMLQCIQTLFIDDSSNDSSPNGCGWLLDNLTSYRTCMAISSDLTCFIRVVPKFWFPFCWIPKAFRITSFSRFRCNDKKCELTIVNEHALTIFHMIFCWPIFFFTFYSTHCLWLSYPTFWFLFHNFGYLTTFWIFRCLSQSFCVIIFHAYTGIW